MTYDNDFYTFMIIGTINCTYGIFSPEDRFLHTLEAIDSVKRKVPDAKILLIDNSNEPIDEDWKKTIESKVDVFHQIQHNLFSLVANLDQKKSPAEVNMMWIGFDLLKKHNLVGKRIFKLSGRYRVSDTFDITEYEKPEYDGKYTFSAIKISYTLDDWQNRREVMWLQTGLISFTPNLLDEFQNMMLSVLRHFDLDRGLCIEESLFQHVPHQKIKAVDKEHAEGLKADGQGYVYF